MRKLILLLCTVILSLSAFAQTDKIFYTSTDGSIVTPHKTDVFGANIISNEYKDGQGIITFDGPVTSIGYAAFAACSSLTSITIPEGMTSIGEYAFYQCSSLRDLTVPGSVTNIENYAFQDCLSLEEITLVENLANIGMATFQNCASLKNIIIPNSVLQIGSRAFADCSNLTHITIGKGITRIGATAFLNCKSLVQTNYTGDIADWCNIKFTGAGANPIRVSKNLFINNEEVKDLIIPNTVDSIFDHAFRGCDGFLSVTFPNSVTHIGNNAFSYCDSLTSITIPNSATSIGESAFSNCITLDSVKVEASTPPTLGSTAFNSSPVCFIPCGTETAYESSDWAKYVKEFVASEQFVITVHSNNDGWGTVTIEVNDTHSTPSQGIGIFSVSATKQVTFSPGNLQYHPADNVWRFAPTQTDYIGSANSKISSTYNGWIDLFGWGTGDAPAKSSTSYSDYQTFVDWGTNKIGNDAPNTWRTLTNSEWKYLLKNRPNASSLRGVAQVNGVNGLIFLPDNWSCPAGVTFKSGVHSSFGLKYYAAYQTFTADQWSKLEKSGAIFLPAAGLRNSTDVSSVQLRSFYWSATEYSNSNSARYLLFSSYEASMDYNNRYDGQSVRLVKDLR